MTRFTEQNNPHIKWKLGDKNQIIMNMNFMSCQKNAWLFVIGEMSFFFSLESEQFFDVVFVIGPIVPYL